MRMLLFATCLAAATLPAAAQTGLSQTGPSQTGPSQAALDEAVKLGTLATLAPLCGLREETWAFDLRRAAILEATRAPSPDDSALGAAPGSELAIAALSFADAEALEDFAEAPREVTCGSLQHNPDLARADAIVQAFRTLKAKKPNS